MNNITPQDLMLIMFAMLIVIIALSLIIIALNNRKNHYKSEMNSFAGGVERSFDFMHHKKLLDEYKVYSSKKFGESNVK